MTDILLHRNLQRPYGDMIAGLLRMTPMLGIVAGVDAYTGGESVSGLFKN